MTNGRAARFLRTVVLVAFVSAPAAAQSAPCPATTLADVLATGSCSIGDKTFQFAKYTKGLVILGQPSGNGVDASLITFTPLTADPNGPGFRLSSTAFALTHDESLIEDLFFTVRVSTPGKLISGFSVAMNNPTLSLGPSSQFEEALLQLDSLMPALSTHDGLNEGCNFVTGCVIGPLSSPPAVVNPGVSVIAFDLNINESISGTGSFDSVDVLMQQAPDPLSYTYSTIDHPSATGNTSIFGINNVGQIVGSYAANALPAPVHHGFLMANGTFTTIDAPSGPDTVAMGINDAGTIVGYSGLLSFGASTGFVDANGVFTNVAVGSSVTRLSGIDNAGLMVGSWEDRTTTPATFHGFFAFSAAGPFNTLDFPGALTSDLTGVNNLGAVTGTYANQIGPPVFGFISLGGQFASTGPFLTINCINDAFAWGGSFTISGVTHGFVVSNGTIRVIDPPGATSTTVYGINNAGTVVGTFTDGTGTHGFIATPGM